jgi:hypothetical protein
MYSLLLDFKPKLDLSLSKSSSLEASSASGELKWDSTKCGTLITFENNKSLVFLREQSYVFRSVITSYGFTSGIHYWEIVADSRT